MQPYAVMKHVSEVLQYPPVVPKHSMCNESRARPLYAKVLLHQFVTSL